jgi:hypothetical protein
VLLLVLLLLGLLLLGLLLLLRELLLLLLLVVAALRSCLLVASSRADPPPLRCRRQQAEEFDPEEDEPMLEPSWPHLQVGVPTRGACRAWSLQHIAEHAQVVYEFFLRFIVSGEVKAKVRVLCVCVHQRETSLQAIIPCCT